MPSFALRGEDGAVGARQLRAVRRVPFLATLQTLAALPPGEALPPWRRPGDAVLAWSLGTKVALSLVARGHLVPALTKGDRPEELLAGWRAVLAPEDVEVVEALSEQMPVTAWASWPNGVDRPDPQLAIRTMLDAVADACARQGHAVRDRHRRSSATPWAEQLPAALVGPDHRVAVRPRVRDRVQQVLGEWVEPVLRIGTERRRLQLVLEAPAEETGEWKLGFWMEDGDRRIEAREVWTGRHGQELEAVLARGLAEASMILPALERATNQARPTHVTLSASEVAELLDHRGRDLAEHGMALVVPAELQQLDAARIRLRVRVGARTEAAGRVRRPRLGLAALSGFRAEAAIGDEVLDDDELAAFAQARSPLVRWRGRWVRVDPEDVARATEAAGSSGSLALTEALAGALTGRVRLGDDLGEVDVVATGEVADLVGRLRATPRPEAAEIVGITGELRPYQRRGAAWLQGLASLGIGGILADDMGVGKSLQAIALLTSRLTARPHLIVCPTSVVGHWERELARFAPKLPVLRHHGPDRPTVPAEFPPATVVVTSYALLRRDAHLLSRVGWNVAVFDEAQQIKNAASKGARAARDIDAEVKVAMTGTPVENRLAELWAMLDLTNPGLMGSQRRFAEQFARPIERWQDRDAAERLRRLTAPFILRRTKADPEVTADLPPKQVVTVACSLTAEQAALYQDALDRAFEAGLGTNPFERRGRILALLTALKQICNHPVQYRGDDGPLRGRSGKLSRASEILAEVVDAGDHALVFTQFVAMGKLLRQHLEAQLGIPEVPFLHGAVPLAQRERMVTRFQEDDDAPPILLVSLRAGGTGLTLHRATHVMHYDQWWNPAVEDQATDRAHRIGQTRPVTVHRLVTGGTVEERIDALLEHKRALADAVLGTGEHWLSDLGDDELAALVRLSRDDVEDEEDER